MSDRLVMVLEQGRTLTRGMGKRGQSPILYVDEDDALDVTVDWSDWLGTDTIASVDNETTHAAVSNVSNTTTTTRMTFASATHGYVQHRVKTAAGRTKDLVIYLDVEQESYRPARGYGYWPIS